MVRTVGKWALWVGMTAAVVGVGLIVLRNIPPAQRAVGLVPPERKMGDWIRKVLGQGQ
jgi:hypothetical protein